MNQNRSTEAYGNRNNKYGKKKKKYIIRSLKMNISVELQTDLDQKEKNLTNNEIAQRFRNKITKKARRKFDGFLPKKKKNNNSNKKKKKIVRFA